MKMTKLDENRWRIEPAGGMRVPGILYSSERLMRDMGNDESPQQVVNVAHLPGIVKYSLAMPDMHWGYGFPTGRASLRIERNASGEQEGRLGDEGLHGFAFHVG